MDAYSEHSHRGASPETFACATTHLDFSNYYECLMAQKCLHDYCQYFFYIDGVILCSHPERDYFDIRLSSHKRAA